MTFINKERIEFLRQLEKETNEKIIAELLMLFEKNTPGILESIQHAANTNDYYTIAVLAHKLKTSCANLGATEMYESCLSLEMESKKHNSECFQRLCNTLKTQFKDVTSELRSYL